MPKATEDKRPRGDGSIYWNDRWGVYQGVIRINGKRRSVSDKDRDECAAKLRRLRQQLGRGGATETDETLGEFLDSWLARQWDFVDTGEKNEKTVKDYAHSITKAKERLGTIPLKDLSALAIFLELERLAKSGKAARVYSGKARKRTARIVRQPLSRRDVKRVRSLLINALDEAVLYGKLDRNEARLTRLPATQPPEPQKALSEEDIQQVLRVAEENDLLLYASLLTGFSNGLRPGELLGAQWHNVEWNLFTDDNGQTFGAIEIEETLKVEGGYVRNGEKVPERRQMGAVKGEVAASERIMALDPRVLKALRRWQVKQKEEQLRAGENWQGNEHDLIFTSRIGTPINDGNLRRRTDRLFATAGIEGHYSLKEITRHTFATLIEAHLAAPALERAMGHVVGGVALSEGLTTSRKPYIHRKKAVITEHLEPIGRILDGV